MKEGDVIYILKSTKRSISLVKAKVKTLYREIDGIYSYKILKIYFSLPYHKAGSGLFDSRRLWNYYSNNINDLNRKAIKGIFNLYRFSY